MPKKGFKSAPGRKTKRKGPGNPPGVLPPGVQSWYPPPGMKMPAPGGMPPGMRRTMSPPGAPGKPRRKKRK